MATQPADLRMTLAEFLDWDDGTDTRYELIDGRVLAMAPPSPRHSALHRTARPNHRQRPRRHHVMFVEPAS